MWSHFNVKNPRKENDSSCKKIFHKRLHILSWLPKYTKIDFICDLIAGITVGLTMMPQSIAYASLADIPAQNGLYTALMGSFIYIFFGTIKEASIGPTSLLALLTYSYTEGLGIEYVVLLCFTTGCLELAMGILKLGFLVDFISAPVTSAFTSATSLIIMCAQFKGLLGMRFKSKGLYDLFRQIFQRSNEIKMGDTTLGISCIVFLLACRQLGKLNVRNAKLKKALWFLSISKNALIITVATIIASLLHANYDIIPFRVVGNVPGGLPTFKLPAFGTQEGNKSVGFGDMIDTLGSGVVVMPIVAIFQNIAIGKSFSSGVIVDATQEMMTLGLANIVGSFVQAMPATGAFTRSAVNNASGVKTPLSGLYAASIIMLALTFLTPYFYFIPKSTLSAILITAVVFMVDYEIVPKLWRCNKFDSMVHMVTLLLCLFCGVEIGLLIGILFNIGALLKPWTRPSIQTKIIKNASDEEYLIVKPELGLCFPAVDYFTEEVVKNSVGNTIPVAIDFTNVLTIDYSGCQALQKLVQMFNKKSQEIIFLNIDDGVYRRIKTMMDENNLNVIDGLEVLKNGGAPKSFFEENEFEKIDESTPSICVS